VIPVQRGTGARTARHASATVEPVSRALLVMGAAIANSGSMATRVPRAIPITTDSTASRASLACMAPAVKAVLEWVAVSVTLAGQERYVMCACRAITAWRAHRVTVPPTPSVTPDCWVLGSARA
jgi:hypothetical protein